MVEGKLKNGFEVKIEDENLDDFEVFEAICDIEEDSENMGKTVFIFKRLLGKTQYDKLKEHMRNETGKISTTEMIEVLKEILNLENDIKNS